MSRSRRARRRLAAKVSGVQTEVVARSPARIGGGLVAVAADDGYGGAAERSHRGGFFGGVAEPLAGEGRFDFEDGVDALGGKVDSGGVREQGRSIEVVEDGDVDLAGAAAGGVDDEGGRGSVPLGEVAIEKLEPVMFGGGSGGGSVFEEATDGELGEHFVLDSAEDFGEVDLAGIGSAGHDGSRVAEQIAVEVHRKREVIDRRQDRLSHSNPQHRSQSDGVMVGRYWRR